MRLAGTVTAVLLCVAGAAQFYSTESAFQEQHRDQFLISSQEANFAPLAAMVQRGPVGYITDAQPGSGADGSLFLSAQYWMAPRLLVKGTNSEFVVGNFGKPADFAAIGRTHGLRLVRDFGDGLVLYQRVP
jgi:hypothetical protein